MADMSSAAAQRIAPLGLTPGSALLRRAKSAAGRAEPTFADTLKQAIGEVSAAQDNAIDTVQAYLRGEPVELHQVMAASEEAGIALEMLVELRNKLTEAYRTVINMQS